MATAALREELRTAAGQDAWCLANIDPELLLLEPELFHTAWFDYRGLHPLRRTAMFARHYNQIVAETITKEVDYNTGKWAGKKRGSFDLLSAQPSIRTAFWRARQQAERIGCPYPIYIRAVIRHFRDRGWKHIPGPNQLFSEEALEVAANAWIETSQASVVWPNSMGCYADSTTWFKHDFDQWFLIHVMRRTQWQHILRDAVRKNLLTPAQIDAAKLSIGGNTKHG